MVHPILLQSHKLKAEIKQLSFFLGGPPCTLPEKDCIINEMVSAHQVQQSTSENDLEQSDDTSDNSASGNQNGNGQRQEQQVQWNARLQTGTQGFQCRMCSHLQSKPTVDKMEQPIDCENELPMDICFWMQ